MKVNVLVVVNVFVIARPPCTTTTNPTPPHTLQVSLEISDCTRRAFPKESFDAIFSRDTLLHVHDKPHLFARLHETLKPGGQLLVTDYCRGAAEPSEEFSRYIQERAYDLHTVQSYRAMLEAAGFAVAEASDETARFVELLAGELGELQARRGEFVEQFSEEAFAEMESSWQSKLARARAGEHCWGVFRAQKRA